jgi:hypothetical protein
MTMVIAAKDYFILKTDLAQLEEDAAGELAASNTLDYVAEEYADFCEGRLEVIHL